MTRIVFMGTPEFACEPLRAMIECGMNVVGVFTQPDKPSGRGKKLAPPPVKVLAQSHQIPVVQVEKIRRPDGLEALREFAPDLCVTAAFGQILSRDNLSIPKYGTVNVHASLLPEYRGPAPINWCIIDGCKQTGVTTMFTDAGIDTGDMIFSEKTDIGSGETAGELGLRLSKIGAGLLIKTIKAIENGDCPRTRQDESKASYKPMLTKELGHIDFNQDANVLSRLVDGVNPWPGAFCGFNGGTLKVWRAKAIQNDFEGRPGQVVVSDAKNGLIVKCGSGALSLEEIQAPAAKRMSAKAYLLGKAIPVGTVLND